MDKLFALVIVVTQPYGTGSSDSMRFETYTECREAAMQVKREIETLMSTVRWSCVANVAAHRR